MNDDLKEKAIMAIGRISDDEPWTHKTVNDLIQGHANWRTVIANAHNNSVNKYVHAIDAIYECSVATKPEERFGLCLSHRAAYRLAKPERCPICRLLEENSRAAHLALTGKSDEVIEIDEEGKVSAAHASDKRHHYQAEEGFPCPCGKPIDHPIHIPRINP